MCGMMWKEMIQCVRRDKAEQVPNAMKTGKSSGHSGVSLELIAASGGNRNSSDG